MASILARIMVPAHLSVGGAKKETGPIIIRKSPDRDSWVTVRDGAEWTVSPVALIESKADVGASLYVVDSSLLTDSRVQREVKVYSLHLAQTSGGEVFIWAARVGDDNWALSAQKGVELARKSWVRVVSSREAGRYETFTPEAELNVDLAWPAEITSFAVALELAMRDRYVDSIEHGLLKKLRGAF